MNEPTLKLPRSADDLLRDFPIIEPDFEAQAKAIEARLKGDAKDPGALLPPSAGISVDDLLKAPELQAEPGENAPPASAVSAVRTAEPPKAAEPPKSNFAEMARKSLQKNEDDSAQIAKELLAATAQSRRPSAEMVERVRAAGRPSATTTPLPSNESGDEAPRNSGVVARAEAAAPASEPASSNRGTVIGIAAAALALAACVALFIKSGQSEDSTAALAAEKASQPAAAAPAKPVAPTQAQPSEGVMSPEALAAAPEAAAREVAKGAAPKAAPGAGPVAATPGKAAPAGAKPEAVVLEDDPEPSKAPPAAEAKAEPAQPEPPLKPAQGSSDNVPLTPSAGAVSTALNSVRGSAQACLAGQTEAVTATVVFAADGHVLSVRAGGSSSACIQAALSKARISPFAKDSFTATTTIRPP